MVTAKQTEFSFPFVVSTILLASLSLLPQASIYVRNDMMGILCTLYFAFFVRKYISALKAFRIMSYSLPLLLVMWLVTYGGDFKYGFMLQAMTMWTIIMPCFASIAVNRRNNRHEQKYILWGTILIFAYISYNTLTALAVDPNVMRANEGLGVYYTQTYQYMLRVQGVGNYGYAYAMGALFVALFAIRSFIKQKSSKILLYACLFFCAAIVVLSQYATLLFISIFSVCFYFAITANSASKRFGIFFIVVILYFSFQALINIGISVFEGQTLGQKFQFIYDGIWGYSDLEHISSDRSEKQLNAFRFFLQSPIFGNRLNASGVSEAVNFAHSTIVSTMAQTGLIGLLSYIAVFYKTLKFQTKSIFSFYQAKAYYTVLAFYVFFAFFNPVDYSFECSWTIFFTVPLIYNYFIENKV